MGQITADQSQQVMAILATNVDWSQIDFDELGLQDTVIRDPKKAGEHFTAFLRNRARVMVGESKSFKIDRSNPFNPAKFIGSGVTIWLGPKDGNGLRGREEQDSHSLDLSEISIAKLRFEHMLKDGEALITGEEKLKRHLAAKHILADAKIAQTLFEEPGQVTLEWLHKNFGVTWMEFPGTTLRDPGGFRRFLCLYRGGGGRWRWDHGWLGDGRSRHFVSVVLAR